MEDNTSNGNAEQAYKEVVVDDAVAGEEDHVSVLDKVAAAAEKIFDRSSSSSSSSDDEAEPPKPEPEPEPELEPEHNAAEELACDDEKAENTEPIAETVLEEDASASAVAEEVVSKVVEESVVVESPQVVAEAEPSEPCGVVGVTRESLQRESWNSCCGLFEVLRRS